MIIFTSGISIHHILGFTSKGVLPTRRLSLNRLSHAIIMASYGCCLQTGSAPTGRWSTKPIFCTNSSKIKCLNRNLPFFVQVGPFPAFIVLLPSLTCMLPWSLMSRIVPVVGFWKNVWHHHWCRRFWDEVRLWICRNLREHQFCFDLLHSYAEIWYA